MPIVDSSFSVAPAEIDGRSYVLEIHVDQYGIEHRTEYLAEAAENYGAVMAARVPFLDQMLIDSEINQVLLDNGNGP